MHLIYKKIWVEIARHQKSCGASAGRPPKDHETRPFYKQAAIYKRAVEKLPPSERKAWYAYVEAENAGLKSTARAFANQNRIASRKSGGGSWNLPDRLIRRNDHRSAAKRDRQVAIIQEIKNMKLAGEKITGKTVGKKIFSLYKELQPITPDTLRKEIALLKKAAHL